MQVKTDAVVSGSIFRKLQPDMILPDAGALVLIDPTHPLNPWANGYIPAHGGTVPNIASAQALAMVGGAASEVMPPAYNTGTVDGATIIRSRTSKGAIRAKGLYFGLRPSAKTMDYLIANPTHNFYVSLYTKVNEATGGSFQLFSLRDGAASAQYIAVMNVDGSVTPAAGAARHLGTYKDGVQPNTIGMMFNSVGFTGSAFAAGQTGSSLIAANQVSLFGPYANSNATDRTTYSFYMEDLTVSGRTYAEVLAIDKARYTKLFAAGGRYADDV
jgi:hypothetical protein